MKRLVVYWIWLCAIGLATSGCADTLSKTEQFEWRTRYYEARMGLEEETEIRFETGPRGGCAEVTWEPWIGLRSIEHRLTTYYDPTREGCRGPTDLALHEACHRRMMHHWMSEEIIEELGVDKEAEAKACERWYREADSVR